MSFVDFVWVGLFAFIGATIGFWTLRVSEGLPKNRIVSEGMKSILAGIFAAVVAYGLMREFTSLSHTAALLLAGAFAFGGIDAAVVVYKNVSSRADKLTKRD